MLHCDTQCGSLGVVMTETEMESALSELDRLLNDPDVRMDPARVWALAETLSAEGTATPRSAGR